MQYFDDLNSKHFSFESFAAGLQADSFAVVNFKGYEAISTAYDFEIMLLSSNREIDLEDVLKSQAVLTIHRGDSDDVFYNGILSEFDQLHEVNDVIFYRARLVPKFWWLTLTHHNQVFLKHSVPELVEEALRDGGLSSDDMDLSTLSGYEPLEYTCQYDETHFNFVSRHLERQGIYYYFNQQDDNDVLVLTDSKFSHEALKQGADLFYNPASGLEGHHLGEAIGSFTCRQKQLPTEIILKDYNYERPSLDITSRAEVDAAGRGLSYLYGEFFATPEEGERLANIRAEELLCKKQEFFGESTVPYIMPGFTFNLHNHYREDFNQEYFIVEVTHEGNQSHLLSSSLASAVASTTEHSQAIYQNNFKAIPNNVQFRPERVTEKPKISGSIHARIDSEVDSEYAQLDELGRYRVRLPFDINDEHLDGKGSAPIRMMQPYAGKNRGMQFPLVKGTEVLLTFIEGNPDRPVIAGAVANPETQSPVNAENQSESVIQTGGFNKIRFEDEAGSERIIMESPTSNSWMRIGAPNDPPASNPNAPSGNNQSNSGQKGPVDLDGDGKQEIDYASNGIRIKSDGSLWHEALNVYGDYVAGAPKDASKDSSDANYSANTTANKMLSFFNGTGSVRYKPSNLKSRHGGADESLEDALNKSHIKVSSLDTFTTQEGNIYDFGGYWNYNLGNSFAEEHINQSAALNQQYSRFWPKDNGETGTDVTIREGAETGARAGAGIAAFLGSVGGGMAAAQAPHQGGAGGAIMLGITASATAGFTAAVSAIGATLGAFAATGEQFQGNIGDVMEGPGTGSIQTWAGRVGSSFKNVDSSSGKLNGDAVQLKSPKKDKGAPMHTDTTWVTKQFGDAYNFNRGNDISIRIGNTEDHQHGNTFECVYGGTHESLKYNGKGKKTGWEKSGGGEKHEAKWDSITGKCVAYEYSKSGHFSFSLAMPAIPKLSINVSLTTLDASVDLKAGTSISVSAAASLAINVSLSAGLSIDIERSVGGKLLNDETTKGFEFKAVGMKAAKKAELEAEKANTKLLNAMMHISRNDLIVGKAGVRMSTGELYADQSQFKFF